MTIPSHQSYIKSKRYEKGEEYLQKAIKKRREKMNKPELKLAGRDGNAFFILGRAQEVAKRAGWSKEKIDEFIKEAQSRDYDHLLQTCMNYFDVI